VSHHANTSCTVDHGSGRCSWEDPETKTCSNAGDWWITKDITGIYGGVRPPKYRVEVRSDEDGSVDEVLLHDSERMLMHLERMSKDSWWFGIYPEADPPDEWDSDARFDIVRYRKRVEVEQR
jgi:hypothetical protein